MAARQTKKELDCNECENRMPEIMDDVSEYFECFTLCDSQFRAGFGGAYALDWNVIIKVAAALRININDKFFTMLKIFENTLLKEINHESKSETDAEYLKSIHELKDNG